MRVGLCKECIGEVPINKTTQLEDLPECTLQLFGDEIILPASSNNKIWECPHCAYPNNMDDFLNIYTKLSKKALDARKKKVFDTVKNKTYTTYERQAKLRRLGEDPRERI